MDYRVPYMLILSFGPDYGGLRGPLHVEFKSGALEYEGRRGPLHVDFNSWAGGLRGDYEVPYMLILSSGRGKKGDD